MKEAGKVWACEGTKRTAGWECSWKVGKPETVVKVPAWWREYSSSSFLDLAEGAARPVAAEANKARGRRNKQRTQLLFSSGSPRGNSQSRRPQRESVRE